MPHASFLLMKIFTCLLLAALVPLSAEAQNAPSETEPSGSFENLPIPSWGKAVLDSFDNPVHPVVGGVVSGGGLGFGVGYDSPEDTRWYKEGEAMATVRRYWSLRGEFGRRSVSRRTQI